MPEHPQPKARPHPWRDPRSEFHSANWRGKDRRPANQVETPEQRALSDVPYAELEVATNFSFLRSGSHPEEFVERAAALGHRAAAITDRHSLAGVVRAHVAANRVGIPLAVGCRMTLGLEGWEAAREVEEIREAGGRTMRTRAVEALVFPTDRASYGRLCRLLTLGKRRAEKAKCHLALHDLIDYQQGLLVVLLPPEELDARFIETAEGLRRVFDDDRFSIAARWTYGAEDEQRLEQIASVCARVRAPMAATNDVRHHAPSRRALLDVVTCIRLGCTLEEAGLRLSANAERHLKEPEEMARLFRAFPEAIARSAEVAERAAQCSLDELKYQYPDEEIPAGKTPQQHLRDLTFAGARERYPRGLPGKVARQIEHELELIEDLSYAPYFLTVREIVVYARSLGILCQGRGAAANSAVCYCLGVTAVDPDRIDVLFERFVSRERDEPPDIDIDFEHERREEVIQHIYEKYGRDRAALTAEVITYRGRSAIREVGKAMGLSLDCVDRMAKSLDWWDGGVVHPDRLREIGLNPEEPRLRQTLALARQILGFPRHLSQHVGGFVITRDLLCETVPIENAAMEQRTIIEWDKDDIDALGMLKVDILGLGMLTCVSKAMTFVNEIEGGRNGAPLELHTIPAEDPEVYDMICKADTVGVFQIESRAQMSMLPRLKPRTFYDLVIEVAIVRPGPIQGDMVHPYLRRRSGEEPVHFPDERVKRVLGRTLGVPLFQEQAMALAVEAAGFTAGEADQLRRAIAAWKTRGNVIAAFGARIIDGMIAQGYARDFAERCFQQIKGFSGYGFPESHAASFALIVYASCWLKRHHPAAFAAALINSQPMGFYAPAQIVRDAAEHGVDVRAVDVNRSGWDCRLESPAEMRANETPRKNWGGAGPALRLGMRLVKGLPEEEARKIEGAVQRAGPFDSIESLWRASGAKVSALRRLASADAFASMNLDRRRALWETRALRDERLPLFENVDHSQSERAVPVRLPEAGGFRQVTQDYATTGLSLKAHPMSFLRPHLDNMRITRNEELRDPARWPTGRPIDVAGIVLVRQRPSTASGVVFMTIEDETGVANLIIRPKIYQRFRKAARHAIVIRARGRVERQGDVVHVLVRAVEDLSSLTADLPRGSRDFH